MNAIFPKISIVILIYNLSYKDIAPVLESVYSTSYPNFEVIVVDNSEKPNFQMDLTKRKQLEYISGQGNVGPPSGRNLGIKRSTGKYIFFIDDDIYIERDTISNLVQIAENDSSLGIIGASIFQNSSSKLSEYYKNYIDQNPDGNIIDIPVVFNCSMFVRRKVFERIGLYDGIYFFYHEEDDLCFRAREAGYRTVISLKAHTRHIGQPDDPTKLFTPKRTYFFYRNFFVFAGRNSQNARNIINYLMKNLIFIKKSMIPAFF